MSSRSNGKVMPYSLGWSYNRKDPISQWNDVRLIHAASEKEAKEIYVKYHCTKTSKDSSAVLHCKVSNNTPRKGR